MKLALMYELVGLPVPSRRITLSSHTSTISLSDGQGRLDCESKRGCDVCPVPGVVVRENVSEAVFDFR
jgi:hypothetical protein